jgi:hypothetical protein
MTFQILYLFLKNKIKFNSSKERMALDFRKASFASKAGNRISIQ